MPPLLQIPTEPVVARSAPKQTSHDATDACIHNGRGSTGAAARKVPYRTSGEVPVSALLVYLSVKGSAACF